MMQWLQNHQDVLWWLVSLSAITFAAALIAVFWLAVKMPPDYFSDEKEPDAKSVGGLWRKGLVIVKNLLGAVFILAGFLMLLLPGQGVLTILVGVVIMDFPGKHRLEKWIVKRPPVLRSINWLRRKSGRAPLII